MRATTWPQEVTGRTRSSIRTWPRTCVQAAAHNGEILVGDTKSPRLAFAAAPADFAALTDQIKAGHLDHLLI